MEPFNRKRGNIKRKITMLDAKVTLLEVAPEQLPAYEEYLSDLEATSKEYIEVKRLIIEEIDRLEEAEEKTPQEIVDLFADQEKHFFEIEDSFVMLKASIKSIISKLKGPIITNQPLVNNNTGHNSCISKVQLPQMKLPKFSGRYEEFESFREKFLALVGSSNEIKVIQKFQLLLDCLSDNVKKSFDHLELTEANYLVVWDQLKARYSNKKMSVEKHVSGLVGMKSMGKESSAELQRVLDETSVHVAALENLGVNVGAWDVMIVYLVSIRLDNETRKKWEETVNKDELPVWAVMKAFLQKRCNSLESVELAIDVKKKPSSSSQPSTSKATKSFAVTEDSSSCLKCDGSHKLSECKEFGSLPVEKRFNFAKSKRICFNCFSQSHRSDHCPLQMSCSMCPNLTKRKHSHLLHFGKKSEDKIDEESKNSNEKSEEKSKQTTSLNVSLANQRPQQVVLMTALIYVYGKDDQPQLARALLDSASESCFVTSDLAARLQLSVQPWNQPIIGIQGAKSQCKGKLSVYIRSRNQDYGKTLECLVIEKISKSIPSKEFSVKNWGIPSKLQLADPDFNKPGAIDMLIGAELFMELLLRGTVKLGNCLPFLQESWLGWVVSGKAHKTIEKEIEEEVVCSLVTNGDLSDQIEKFWKMEECLTVDDRTLEEKLSEEKFCSQVSRDSDGRYVVGMLLNDKIGSLGDSRKIAEVRLNSLWRKFEANPDLKRMYCDFMSEYLNLNHMKEVDGSEKGVHGSYYLPHHGVMKPDNKTTKLRVVFNGSQKSSTGVSLNDCLMNGGLIQPFLHSILMNHRLYRFVFSVDIVKMYRGFRMNPEFTSLLRILFRWEKDGPIKTYEASTVTYGTKDAPFVAVRTLVQIALDSKEKYPLAYKVLMNAFFMDNGLYGADSLEEAIQMIDELILVMEGARLKLHKWSANDKRMLRKIPVECQEIVSLGDDESDVVKTLGMLWNPREDNYKFVVSKNDSKTLITKRVVLSELARVFDPLGLLNPVIVRAKLFMQKIWITKYDWDDRLPEELGSQWMEFRDDLQLAAEIEVPRFINPAMASRFQLVGFSDASQDAYGMCLYIRCLADNEETSMNLIFSKSRVAPIVAVSIPRLELESALLLAEATSFVLKTIHLKFESVLLFSDSKVTLSWLRTDYLKLQIYVANRVKKIQELTRECTWNYVPTKSNPADIVSRGSSAQKLKMNELWWKGPDLNGDSFEQPDKLSDAESTFFEREMRKLKIPTTSLVVSGDRTMYGRFEEIPKIFEMQRVMARVLRYIDNLRRSRNKLERVIGRLSTAELSRAMEKLVYIVQLESFEGEKKALEKDGMVPNKHILKPLNPILVNGVIRVGGRISNSGYGYDKKHQMLLPKDHEFTKRLIVELHERYLHVGPQGLLAILRERFWLINGKKVIRKVLHECVDCFKVNPKSIETFMGDLPNYRVEQSFPFYHTGVDYAGPIFIKLGGPRSKLKAKAWISLFICMATKAIHLELVTSLSTEAFKACLYRFICRRGRPKSIHSDNGTNFIGCKNELLELKALLNSRSQREIANYCLEEGMTWSTIPPRASHFGGEWEAGVKSVKYHFKRIVGDASLTYEETLTLLVQIEGILNSRPLYAMSSDPNDFTPITPAHFLIGRSITNIPESHFLEIKDNRLTRYERIVKMRQHFWKQFSREYVTSLQQRSKWFKSKPTVEVGKLALLKEEDTPSYQWETGRIIKTFPGKDQVVRVVLLEMPNGKQFKRDTLKICLLPTEKEVFELSFGGNPPPGGEC